MYLSIYLSNAHVQLLMVSIYFIASTNTRHPAPIAASIAIIQNANAKWLLNVINFNFSFISAAYTAMEIKIKMAAMKEK